MKKSLILILLITLSGHLFAQNEPLSSEKKLKFGINVGLNYSNLVFDESTLPTNNTINESFGFQLGILADYQFSKYFLVSPRASLVFNEMSIDINENFNYELVPFGLELSTYLKFQKPIGKIKPYVFSGFAYKVDLKKQPTTSADFGTDDYLAIDFGIGLEKAFKHVNFAPELKYSYGLYSPNQHPSLQLFYVHQISLVFNFLG